MGLGTGKKNIKEVDSARTAKNQGESGNVGREAVGILHLSPYQLQSLKSESAFHGARTVNMTSQVERADRGRSVITRFAPLRSGAENPLEMLYWQVGDADECFGSQASLKFIPLHRFGFDKSETDYLPRSQNQTVLFHGVPSNPQVPPSLKGHHTHNVEGAWSHVGHARIHPNADRSRL